VAPTFTHELSDILWNVTHRPPLNRPLPALLAVLLISLAACSSSPTTAASQPVGVPSVVPASTAAPSATKTELVAQGSLGAGCPSVESVSATVGNPVVPGFDQGMGNCDYIGTLYSVGKLLNTNVPLADWRDEVGQYPNPKLVEQPALGNGAFYIYTQGPIVRTNTQDEMCLVFASTKAGVVNVNVSVDNKPPTGEKAICSVAVSAFKKFWAK
jgi:hypothetical protein